MAVNKPNLSSQNGGFVAGTLVHTKEGLVPIEKIKVGDHVISKPEIGEGDQACKKVTRTVSFDDKDVWTIAFSEKDVTDPNVDSLIYHRDCTRIVGTPNHPFWVVGKGWTALRDLCLYDHLLLENGTEVVIYEHMNLYKYESSTTLGYADTTAGMYEGHLIDLSLHTDIEFCFPEETVPEPLESDFYNLETHVKTRVYNFKVEDFYTYFIGTKGVWVHNSQAI